MRNITRYAAAGAVAAVLAGGGFATGQSAAAPQEPKVPASCVAPLDGGKYKMVPDGDAELYQGGVYVCVRGLWILDVDYGQ